MGHMNKGKVLQDVIQSAIGMKAHYDTWRALVSHAKQQSYYKKAIHLHSDFLKATEDAHYTAMFIYFFHLYDKNKDSSSIPNCLLFLEPEQQQDLQEQFNLLSQRAKPIIQVRHKLVAHIHNQISEAELFRRVAMKWDDIGQLFYDTSDFVALLADSTPNNLGIPRDGRMLEAVERVIYKLSNG